jgi:Dimerisation domain
MAGVTPDPIMQIAMGFMAAKHLFVASEIGVFENLAGGPATLDELAAKSGIPQRTLRISADAMVSLGLLERDGDRYCNSAIAAAFLAGASGPDLRPMLRFWNRISYPAWLNLESAVRSGQGQGNFFRFSEEEQQIFSVGVEAFSAGAAAALAIKGRITAPGSNSSATFIAPAVSAIRSLPASSAARTQSLQSRREMPI